MINLKCRKLFLRGKEFHCLVKQKAIINCDKDCKNMVLSLAWQQLLNNEELK